MSGGASFPVGSHHDDSPDLCKFLGKDTDTGSMDAVVIGDKNQQGGLEKKRW
jgi:hypothetical protein